MVQPRSGNVKLQFAGEVRTWRFWQELHAGTQFIGTGYPVLMTPETRGMTTAAGFVAGDDVNAGDTISVWTGDQNPADAVFATYRYVNAGNGTWLKSAEEGAGQKVRFEPYRAAYMLINSQLRGWLIDAPGH